LRISKSYLGAIYRSVKRMNSFILIFILTKTFFRTPNHRLCVALDTSRLSDGSGAQLQRILSTRLISHAFKVGYFHNAIHGVQIHPLDPFQDENSYRDYLSRLNRMILIDDVGDNQGYQERLVLKSISLGKLFLYQVLSRALNRNFLLLITDPYPISEYLVRSFPEIRNYLSPSFCFGVRTEQPSKPKIVIHHRYGVGGKAIYPGQRISRELDVSYFIGILDVISSNYEKVSKGDMEISLLTDAPLGEIIYAPPVEQLDLWEGTPNFQDGVVKITGSSLEEIFMKSGYEISVKSGGDPLEAILEMSQSDYLITARSSLSYVAGILNESGTVFSAPGFWHSPLPSWKRGA